MGSWSRSSPWAASLADGLSEPEPAHRGLGQRRVVVGARESSGALLTAQWAEELGRPVGAVPGDTRDERHRGAIALIEKGAHLIGSADDALRMVGLDPRQTKPATPARKPALSPTEQRV